MDNELFDIVGDIYDCAIEPARWPHTLERIVDHVDGACAAIHVHDPTERGVRFVAECRTDPEYQRLYSETYAALNPMLTSGWFAELDEPITIVGQLGEESWRQARVYREWTKPQGYLDAAAVTLAKSARRHAQASIIRFERQGVFDAASLQPLRLLAPHIRRSVTIADLLDARALRQDMLSATLDLLVVGIVLVDGEGRIAHANRAGLRYMEEAQAVRRYGDQLSARDPGAAAALKDAVLKAAQGNALELTKTGIAVPIAGIGGRDLAAWVLPLDTGLRIELAAPFAAKAAVFLKEIGDAAPLPGELFVRRYGITAAECRVLMLLTQGLSPHETADALGCSEPTVRTHLQRLFTKTGTRGQPDLMRLAMSALAPASR